MNSRPQVNLRGRRAVIIHPPDSDAQELSRQLSRIGLSVSCLWPCVGAPAAGNDFVFVMISEALNVGPLLAQLDGRERAVRVVILENESPTVLEKIMKLDADTVIVKPFRPVGLLAHLVHALHKRDRERMLSDRARSLERKLQGFRTVEQAKEILMARHGISGEEAFARLRRHAMNERTSVEHVAATIVDADRFTKTVAS
jgi:AmiR/NasT family two-component response regulator